MQRFVLKRLSFPLALFIAGPAHASEYQGAATSVHWDGDPPTIIAGCISAAARVHRLPAPALAILLSVEGGTPGRVSQNRNGTVDVGPMQINERWLPRLADHWRAPLPVAFLALRDNFCANVEAGSWILRTAIDEAGGDFWEGMARYHSHDPALKTAYLHKVLLQAQRLPAETPPTRYSQGNRS